MTDDRSGIGDRMDGGYEPPILIEPQGGPIPQGQDSNDTDTDTDTEDGDEPE